MSSYSGNRETCMGTAELQVGLWQPINRTHIKIIFKIMDSQCYF